MITPMENRVAVHVLDDDLRRPSGIELLQAPDHHAPERGKIFALGPKVHEDMPELKKGQVILFQRGAGTGNDVTDPDTDKTYRMVRTEHIMAIVAEER